MNNQQFRKFYDHEYGMVYYWLLSKLRNRAEAEDVAGQAFLKAWEKRKTLKDISKSHQWIMQIAHLTMIDSWRLARRRPEEPMTDSLNVIDRRDFTIELEHWFEFQRAANAVTLLDSIYRKAIANAIRGIPQQGTAGSRLFNARKQVRELCAA